MSASTPDALIEAYSAVSAANRRTADKLTVVLEHFRDAGIECLLLKGADLLHRLYGVWGLRSMADVDLLVREHDLPAIDRVLKESGYLTTIDGNPAYHAQDYSLLMDLTTDVWYQENTDELWRRAIRFNFGNVPVLRMGSEDLLIFLTAYAVLYRGSFTPAFSQDLALLTKKEPLNWDVIVKEAVRCHLKIPLFHGLSYAAGHGAAIPPHVLARLAPVGASEKLLAVLLRRLVDERPLDGIGQFLLLITRPPGKKWRWLRNVLYPSRQFLTYRYGSEGRTSPMWTRFKRVGYLSWWAVRLSAQMLYRLATPARSVV